MKDRQLITIAVLFTLIYLLLRKPSVVAVPVASTNGSNKQLRADLTSADAMLLERINSIENQVKVLGAIVNESPYQ